MTRCSTGTRLLAKISIRRLANRACSKCQQFRLRGGQRLAMDRKTADALQREPGAVVGVRMEAPEVDREEEVVRECCSLLRCAERRVWRECRAVKPEEAAK